MAHLTAFTDFVNLTGPAVMTSPDKLINEAVTQSYILSRFLRGRDMAEIVQGGDEIKDWVMFDESNTGTNYSPNERFTWANPQVSTEIKVPWRFSADHMSWTDQEIELNVPSGLTRAATKVAYKNLYKLKEQRLQTSIVKFMESKLFQDPGEPDNSGYTNMEGSTGTEQYSLLAFIEEDSTNFHAEGWTNIMGVNPATEDKWRCQQESYAYANIDTQLFPAFDAIWQDLNFIPPPAVVAGLSTDVFEDQILSASRQFIACSKGGINKVQEILRDSNDTLVSKQDAAYNNPKYSGVDFVRIAYLDSLSFVWDGSAGSTPGTETGFTTDGYRYFCINGNYIKPIFHNRRYFHKHPTMRPSDQPFTTICPVDTWWNLFCSSRQRQGIVYPT